MATAKARKVEKVRVVEEKYTEVDGVTLELTDEETVAVKALLGAVSGVSNYRDAIGRVHNAISNLGYNTYGNLKVNKAVNALEGDIYFRED